MKKNLIVPLMFSILLISTATVQAYPNHHQDFNRGLRPAPMHQNFRPEPPRHHVQPPRPVPVRYYRDSFLGLNFNVGSFMFSVAI